MHHAGRLGRAWLLGVGRFTDSHFQRVRRIKRIWLLYRGVSTVSLYYSTGNVDNDTIWISHQRTERRVVRSEKANCENAMNWTDLSKEESLGLKLSGRRSLGRSEVKWGYPDG